METSNQNSSMNKRLLSLDIFRGMTIFFMIIVNTTGNWNSTYAPLLHAKWHGFTPTDLVFPDFLFAVGASLAIVMKRWQSQVNAAAVYKKIIVRTAIIFLLGFLIYWFPFCDWSSDGTLKLRPFSETRIMGVLQRIALAYGLSAILLYRFSLNTVVKLTIGILIAYWIILLGFGDLTMANNAGRLLDLAVLGENHMYQGEGMAFDPEGLLSTLPCIGNVIAGYTTVYYLRQGRTEHRFKILLWGTVLIGLACLWHYAFPINKKLWTSSYVLLTSGICIVLLMALNSLLDEGQNQNWSKFFTPMGKNPLFIYIISQLGAILLYWFPSQEHDSMYTAIYENIFKWAGAYLGAFLFALSFTMLCWVVALLMDRRKCYVRV